MHTSSCVWVIARYKKLRLEIIIIIIIIIISNLRFLYLAITHTHYYYYYYYVKPTSFYFYSKTIQMHRCVKFILFWNDTLRISDGLSIYHQEFKTVHTAADICQTDTAVCLPASRQTYTMAIHKH